MSILQTIKDFFLIIDEPDEELLSDFQSIVDQEYIQFKDTVLMMDKEDIFSLAYQIDFFDRLHEFIMYEGPIPNEVLYSVDSQNPLALMYEYYKMSGMRGFTSGKDIRKILEMTFVNSEEVLYA